MSADPQIIDDDLYTCEVCSKHIAFEDAVSSGESLFCKSCHDKWLVEFNACDHAWEPSISPDGDEAGQYCPKCSGFLPDYGFREWHPSKADRPACGCDKGAKCLWPNCQQTGAGLGHYP